MSRNARITGLAALLGAAVLVVPALPAHAAPAQEWQLTPPGGQGPVATVTLTAAGALTLGVRRGATQVLEPSPLGIRTSAADLATGLVFTGRADSHVTAAYPTATGRRRQHTADANETTL